MLSVSFHGRNYEDASRGLQEAANALGDAWVDVQASVARDLRAYLTDVAEALAQRHSQPWPTGTSPTSLSRRTGEGVKSILRSVDVRGTTWEQMAGEIGGAPYLAIHETGGTLEPKGQYLTIPLPAATGTDGKAPPARSWSNTFLTRSRAGNLIIFQRRGRDIVPLYVLKTSVYLPPRLGMGEELQDRLPYFMERMADTIAREFYERF